MPSDDACKQHEIEAILRAKLHQAYEVIVQLVGDASTTGAEGRRALDYFQADRFDPHFLPWPREASAGIRPEHLNATNDD